MEEMRKAKGDLGVPSLHALSEHPPPQSLDVFTSLKPSEPSVYGF